MPSAQRIFWEDKLNKSKKSLVCRNCFNLCDFNIFRGFCTWEVGGKKKILMGAVCRNNIFCPAYADYFGSIPCVSRECDKYCCDIFAVRRRGNARRNDCLKTVHISIISQSCRAVKKLFKNGAYCAIIL